MIIPGLTPLTEKFKATEGQISSLIITAPSFFTSLAAFFVVSGADIWGRRPFYIGSIIVLAVANFLAFLAQVSRAKPTRLTRNQVLEY
jgi:MFS family permease